MINADKLQQVIRATVQRVMFESQWLADMQDTFISDEDIADVSHDITMAKLYIERKQAQLQRVMRKYAPHRRRIQRYKR